MKHLSVLVIALFLSSKVFASPITVDGVLEARSGKPVLNTGSMRVVLNPHDQHVFGDLNKLRVGDYISGYGEYDQHNNTLDLQAIETVGLKSLLGRWQATDGQVYEFQTFTTLIFYHSVIQQWVNYAKSFFVEPPRKDQHQLNYTLAPDSRTNRWSIFVADKEKLLIGYLEFKARTLSLTLMEPQTGRQVIKLELSPLQ
jgi:hypothetical protein